MNELPAAEPVRVPANHTVTKRLGHWTTERRFEVRNHHGQAVLDLRSQGHEVVLTHGNGPHVGSLLLQQALGEGEAAPLPLDALIAMTQGQIGYLLESAFAAVSSVCKWSITTSSERTVLP